MIYGGIEEQKKAIVNKAEYLKAVASAIPKVKEVFKKFDGKCYNCKLDNAIKALNTDDLPVRLYSGVSYGDWYYVTAYRKKAYSGDQSILSAYAANREPGRSYDSKYQVFGENKRIDAGKAIERLNKSYEELTKKAADLLRSAEELDTLLSRVKEAQKMLANVMDAIPYEVQDICGLRR